MANTIETYSHPIKSLQPCLEMNRQLLKKRNDPQFIDRFANFVINAESVVSRLWNAYTRQDQSRKTLKHCNYRHKVLHNQACSLCQRIPPSLILLECTKCPHFFICENCLPLSNHPLKHSFVRVLADAPCFDSSMNDYIFEKYILSNHPSRDVNIELLPLLSHCQKDS